MGLRSSRCVIVFTVAIGAEWRCLALLGAAWRCVALLGAAPNCSFVVPWSFFRYSLGTAISGGTSISGRSTGASTDHQLVSLAASRMFSPTARCVFVALSLSLTAGVGFP